MRVTNHFATEQAIAAFAASREKMNAAMDQVTTGRRVQAASDDPAAARTIMQNDSEQRSIDQQQRTIDAATSRLTAEEGAVDQLSNLLTRAKELAVSQASDTSTPAARQAAAAEANQLLAQAVQVANTSYDRGYLFGGRTPSTPPYTVNQAGPAFTFSVSAPAPQGSLLIDAGAGQLMPSSHDGVSVFGDASTGALAALRDLAAALNTGTTAPIAAAIPALDTAIQTTQVVTSETGAWINRLQSASTAGKARGDQLTAATSSLRDVDVEQAITELTGRQTAFQAAMAATARVFGMSLTDYLK